MSFENLCSFFRVSLSVYVLCPAVSLSQRLRNHVRFLFTCFALLSLEGENAKGELFPGLVTFLMGVIGLSPSNWLSIWLFQLLFFHTKINGSSRFFFSLSVGLVTAVMGDVLRARSKGRAFSTHLPVFEECSSVTYGYVSYGTRHKCIITYGCLLTANKVCFCV